MSAEQGKSTPKPKSKEEIYSEFQLLRNQQRNLVTNLTTLEMDLKEHKYNLLKFSFKMKNYSFFFFFRTVVDTLKTVDESRRCFRLIGGVLIEQTVKEVVPQLNGAITKLESLIATGKEQISKKGEEIVKFKEEHNIKIQGQADASTEKPSNASEPASSAAAANRNVLVVNN